MRFPLGKSGKDVIYIKKEDNGKDMLGYELELFLKAVIEDSDVAVPVEQAGEALRVALEIEKICQDSIKNLMTGELS